MRLSLLLLIALVLLFNTSYSSAATGPYGTTGKIAGTITDSKDGSPLVGAIISVEGTSLRAGSDDNGKYAILNVPVGTYQVKCTYVGYEAQVQRDVKISADLTTAVDFALNQGGVTIDTLVIEVKRQTIPTETSGKVIGTEFIQNTGIRGIENIASKTAGVVQDEKGTGINIRGGRGDETSIIIDGVETNNPLTRGSTAVVSNDALEEIAVLTGGFSAEYGNVLSGVINVTTKSGSANYTGSVEAVTDAIAGQWINTTSQGYNVYDASIGGPVIPTKKLSSFWNLYASYERDFDQVSQPISSDAAALWSPSNSILPNFGSSQNAWTGKTIMDFGALTNGKLQLKLTAGYNGNVGQDRQFIGSMGYFDSWHMPLEKTQNHQVFAKVDESFGSKTFYDIQGSYQLTTDYVGDGLYYFNNQVGRDGWTYPWYLAYGDTNVVPGLQFEGSYTDPSANYGVFRDAGRIYPAVSKDKTEQYALTLNFTHQLLTKNLGSHELKFGGDYKQYKIREFSLDPAGYSSLTNTNKYADSSGRMVGSPVIDENGANSNFLTAFGYDPYGNETESDYIVNGLNITQAPKKPKIGDFYILDKMEFQYFNTNIGLRFDYFNPNTNVPVNYAQLKDPTTGNINYTQVKSTFIVSPRLGFSFPVTDKTVFHAQFGKFVQLPSLNELYTNDRTLRYLASGQLGYFTVFNNPLLKPETTTSYEIGIKHTAGDYVTLGVTAYYKETDGLITISSVQALDKSYEMAIYDNGDFGVIRGLDFSLELRRFHRLRATIAYSLAYASGTGSNINTFFNTVYQGDVPPKIPAALDFDQRHTGTFELDYRWGGKEDVPKGFWGGVLEKLGINLLINFNSGRPYTASDPNADPLGVVSASGGNIPTSGINANYGPWNFDVDLKIDKTVKLFDKLNVDLYLQALNLLDNTLTNAVWATSGQPGYTGWLGSPAGIQWANSVGPQAVAYYNIRSHYVNNYGPPRQVRLGLRLSY